MRHSKEQIQKGINDFYESVANTLHTLDILSIDTFNNMVCISRQSYKDIGATDSDFQEAFNKVNEKYKISG